MKWLVPLFILLFSPAVFAAHYSHLHSLFLNDNKTRKRLTNKNEIVWQVNSVPKFTELLLSWNAHRPKKGTFSFFVKTNYGQWSGWQKLAEWSGSYQKSCITTQDKHVQTKHVRVELQPKNFGNAFQIRVVAHDGAKIKDVKALYVCTCNNHNFAFAKADSTLLSVLIKDVPRQSQMQLTHPRFLDLCSPTSCAMLSTFHGRTDQPFDQYCEHFANSVHDSSYLDIYGNWQFNVAHLFHIGKGKLYSRVQRLNDFKDLHSFLTHKIPVAVSVRGEIKNGFKAYNGGHFVVVVGYLAKQKKVLCLDPAFRDAKQMLRAFNFDEFSRAWGKSRNLAYIVWPRERNVE